jgi:hypothetical protein
MNLDTNPLDDYVKSILQNANFLSRLLTPKISVPLIALLLMIIGVIVLKG